MTAWQSKPDGWTAERIALLRELNDKGSNAHIAGRINRVTGSCFSRNAVIGKRMRLGLIEKKPGRPRENTSKHVPRKPRQREFFIPFEPAPIIEETPVPQDFLGVSLLDLNRDQCRYPHGSNPPFTFCGQPIQDGSSYCTAHHRLCYHKPDHSRRRTFIPARPGSIVRAI